MTRPRMTRLRWILVLVSLLSLLALSTVAASAGPPSSATVQFGRTNVGSPFDPFTGHDHSIEAVDIVQPRTVAISRGGSVTFNIAGFHQVAIYAPGKAPGDVALTPETLDDLVLPFPPFVIPDFVINDPAGRVALGPGQLSGVTTWTTPPGTFTERGRYLVICTTLPHFAELGMYGWVVVE